MAMLAKAPYPMVRDAVIAPLALAEGLGPLLSNVAPRPASRTSWSGGSFFLGPRCRQADFQAAWLPSAMLMIQLISRGLPLSGAAGRIA
jgi:hypothetical protein